MDFITWIFGTHYIVSTLFLPCWSFLWAYFYGLKIRMLLSFILCFNFTFLAIINAFFKK